MSRRTVAVAVFLLLLTGLPALAQDFVQTFTGSTVGGPVWRRPFSATTLSSVCTACRYTAQTFVLAADSSCTINSVQNYDGHIVLYKNSFNAGAPLTNLVEVSDDGELGTGTARIPNDLNSDSRLLTAGAYFLVTSGFDNADQGSYTATIQCESAQPLQGSCFFTGVPREKNVCFHNRFIVLIHDVSNHPTDGIATPVRFGSEETAFFWFYGDQNFEVMVKILNACGLNNKWWVFAGALTNQAYHIEIYDLVTTTRRHYWNAQGVNAPAVTDINAFPCP